GSRRRRGQEAEAQKRGARQPQRAADVDQRARVRHDEQRALDEAQEVEVGEAQPPAAAEQVRGQQGDEQGEHDRGRGTEQRGDAELRGASHEVLQVEVDAASDGPAGPGMASCDVPGTWAGRSTSAAMAASRVTSARAGAPSMRLTRRSRAPIEAVPINSENSTSQPTMAASAAGFFRARWTRSISGSSRGTTDARKSTTLPPVKLPSRKRTNVRRWWGNCASAASRGTTGYTRSGPLRRPACSGGSASAASRKRSSIAPVTHGTSAPRSRNRARGSPSVTAIAAPSPRASESTNRVPGSTRT